MKTIKSRTSVTVSDVTNLGLTVSVIAVQVYNDVTRHCCYHRAHHCVVCTRRWPRPQRHASMHCTMHNCTQRQDTCHVSFNVKWFRGCGYVDNSFSAKLMSPKLSRPDNIMLMKRHNLITTSVFINDRNICFIDLQFNWKWLDISCWFYFFNFFNGISHIKINFFTRLSNTTNYKCSIRLYNNPRLLETFNLQTKHKMLLVRTKRFLQVILLCDII